MAAAAAASGEDTQLPVQANTQYAVDDRFFEPKVYVQLQQGEGNVDAHLINPKYDPGQAHYMPEDVAQEAIKIFDARAADEGLHGSDVTRAMFAGEFNPYMSDLRLVHHSFGTPSIEELIRVVPHAEIYINHLTEIGVFDTDENDRPVIDEADYDVHLRGMVHAYRDQMWVERYGTIGDIEQVHTIANGKPETMTGEDIALRAAIRGEGQDFRSDYGLEYNKLHRYQDVLDRLKAQDPALAANFEEQVEAYKQETAYTFFQKSSSFADSYYNFQRDYMLLRKAMHASHRTARSTPTLADETKKQPEQKIPQTANENNKEDWDKGEKITPPESIPPTQQAVSTSSPSIAAVQASLQQFLNAERPNVTGRWDAATDSALKTLLQQLQASPAFGEGWDRPSDGEYTEAFAAHVRARLDHLAKEDGATDALKDFRKFFTQLDRAVAHKDQFSGPIPPKAPAEQLDMPTETVYTSEQSAAGTFIISFLSSVTWELGDNAIRYAVNAFESRALNTPEVWDGYREDRETFVAKRLAQQAQHPTAEMIGAILGLLFSPLPYIVVRAIKANREKLTLGMVAMGAATAEVVEGVFCGIGEYMTFGRILYPEAWFGGILIAIVFATLATSVIFLWKTSRAFKFFIVAGLAVGVIVLFNSI